MDTAPDEVHREDLALVQGAIAMQSDAVSSLIERMQCVPRILRAQNSRIGGALDEHEIADAAQESLIVIWRKLPEYHGRSSIEAWIYRICVLELMSQIRKKRRRRLFSGDLSQAPEPVDPRPIREPYSRYEALHAALARLSVAEQRILHMKHFDGLTLEVISRRLDLPLSTVKTRYYRALSRVEERLDPEDMEPS